MEGLCGICSYSSLFFYPFETQVSIKSGSGNTLGVVISHFMGIKSVNIMIFYCYDITLLLE
jgi:hypothetical protein